MPHFVQLDIFSLRKNSIYAFALQSIRYVAEATRKEIISLAQQVYRLGLR